MRGARPMAIGLFLIAAMACGEADPWVGKWRFFDAEKKGLEQREGAVIKFERGRDGALRAVFSSPKTAEKPTWMIAEEVTELEGSVRVVFFEPKEALTMTGNLRFTDNDTLEGSWVVKDGRTPLATMTIRLDRVR